MADAAAFARLITDIRAEITRIAGAFQVLLDQVAAGGAAGSVEDAFTAEATALVADLKKIGTPATTPADPPADEV